MYQFDLKSETASARIGMLHLCFSRRLCCLVHAAVGCGGPHLLPESIRLLAQLSDLGTTVIKIALQLVGI